MKKRKSLYAITIEDVINVANQENVPFGEKDMPFIGDKIGDYFGDRWQDAVEYALTELKRNRENR